MVLVVVYCVLLVLLMKTKFHISQEAEPLREGQEKVAWAPQGRRPPQTPVQYTTEREGRRRLRSRRRARISITQHQRDKHCGKVSE